jgi:alkylated DNA repair dioxygenase AlkB
MYQIYDFTEWRDFLKIPQNQFCQLVRKFDWKRGLPGGWLVYAPPRQVTAYGDGSLYDEEGRASKKRYHYTAWRASTPASYCTSMVKTAPLPKKFITSGIMKAMRHFLTQNEVMVNNATCTGMWCNYYSEANDNIAGHTDDEDYYVRNRGNDTVFVSLTLYEDEEFGDHNLARFQIKKEGKWQEVALPHLSLLIMNGSCEHRVLKPYKDKFRARYNITFRSPVSYHIDIIKNYRFFSNFGRYYRQTILLYVPPKAFIIPPPKNKKLRYEGKNTARDKEGKQYKLSKEDNYTTKTIKFFSDFAPIELQLNQEANREELLTQLGATSAPATTTNQALLLLLRNIKEGEEIEN